MANLTMRLNSQNPISMNRIFVILFFFPFVIALSDESSGIPASESLLLPLVVSISDIIVIGEPEFIVGEGDVDGAFYHRIAIKYPYKILKGDGPDDVAIDPFSGEEVFVEVQNRKIVIDLFLKKAWTKMKNSANIQRTGQGGYSF